MIIIKSVFCPNDNKLVTSIRSYENLIDYMDYHKIPIKKIFIIGWCRQNLQEKLKQKINNNHNIKFLINSYNRGKMYYIRKIAEKIKNNKVLYMDHDIRLRYDIDIIRPITDDILDKYGTISYNHKEDNRHQSDIIKIEDNIKLVYSPNMNSIAMGCYITNKLYLLADSEFMSVYGMDDYEINRIMNNNNLKCVMTPDIFVIHPFETDMDYKKWKINEVRKIIMEEYNYHRSMEESINLWSRISKFREFNNNYTVTAVTG